MNKYRSFIFRDYDFDAETKELKLVYSLDNAITFTETYRFDFSYADYDPEILDRALQMLFFMAGVSYYKTCVPTKIQVQKGSLGPKDAAFFSKTYRQGLGEFFYVNQLDPKTAINFPVTSGVDLEQIKGANTSGLLVGLGGGKDSLVSVELLKDQPGIATWSVGHRPQLTPLVERINLTHFWVERAWDQQLRTLNDSGAYNGHVPISAILACVGIVVAILSGKRDVIVSNESSANEPNLEYQGVAINHQYSKSLEFEHDYQQYLQRHFGGSVRYYSILRPLSEVHIAEMFAKTSFHKYQDVFSSCNRAFIHDSHRIFWCGECPKCAFVFLALTPFLPRPELETLFHDKNLLLTPQLEPIYGQLLGIEGSKPLECVGEVKESRAAMKLAQQIYPDLAKYQFDLPADYNYKNLSAHAMPLEMYELLLAAL